MSKAVVITSGGLDSTVLCYDAATRYDELHLMSFNYGQRHAKELQYAKKTAQALGAKWDKINLGAITPFLSGSALTDLAEVPEGNYAAENMAATVVPNRNMIMLSIAIAAAVSEGADAVVAGMHAGDHPVYPDCRPEFVRGMDALARVANEGFTRTASFGVIAPFVGISKADIVRRGADLGVDFQSTWSCYRGERIHCGKCGTCVERAESFFIACVDDPTEYQDPHYWKRALGYIQRGVNVG